MKFLEYIKPSLGDTRKIPVDTPRHLFNYKRIWKFVVLITGGVTILPLLFISLVNYIVMQNSIESEFVLRTTRIVSNTRRSISFFLTERKSALDFIVHDNSYENLNNKERLEDILENLKKSFGGGFMDLGVIDSSGFQKNYAGPYSLEGRNYRNQDWFKQVVESGIFISDVFLGYRNIPHLIIAVKSQTSYNNFYILRAALSIYPFEDLLTNLELAGNGDAFMLNNEGILQTPSRYHGNVLEGITLPVPVYSEKSEVLELTSSKNEDLLIGYGYIEESPFILMIVKNKDVLMKPWYGTRLKLIAFLLISLTIILIVIFGMVTYMVKRIKISDEKRVFTLHEVEYSNKMASIGRMAASVAHEINNPLAIINEKAGLIKDLFQLRNEYAKDQKLLDIVNSILSSVKRAGTITKGLLKFSRNLDVHIETIFLKQAIEEVLSFMGKEAEIRAIEIKVEVSGDIPPFKSDRGKLQQIFLNIINNAFASVDEGGHLTIRALPAEKGYISIMFIDDGNGIPEEDINHIFEPFFSTKTGQGGTGLGLSITYNLVQEIGGNISVQSKLGNGTTFNIHLPINLNMEEGESSEKDASIVGG